MTLVFLGHDILLAIERNFSGEFPGTYSSCKPLQRLRVNKKQLFGKIPSSVWGLPDVLMMNFSDNKLTGTMSPEIRVATNLNQSVLSNNKFSCELRKEFEELIHLERLHLDNNDFSGALPSELGSIPNSLSMMTSLNSLNLSLKRLIDDEETLEEAKGTNAKWKLESFYHMEIYADEVCDFNEDNLSESGGTRKVHHFDMQNGCGTVVVKQLCKGNNVKVLTREI
ncbi:hypothetical protein T459_25560 [Capsicum annuum]|uniref:Uncharacterized protein n=1 Tax=Capsicum annuum TaxID=4072 RepID=A0A2G2YL36_CAPAN|nr:hypothetical protein FXO37_10125 [Capsicum annuum]PHT70456.1 hypothetical protein T459_25560 [Capsicum annuum]